MSIRKRICVYVLCLMTLLMSFAFAGCSVECVHTLTRVEPKAATCTEDGNREYYRCDNCGECFADEDGTIKLSADKYVIKTTGHRIMKHNGKDASCANEGVEEYYECRDCGKLFSDKNGTEIESVVVVSKIPHQLTKVAAKAPTGFEYGCIEHYECSVCGNFYSDAQGTIQVSEESVRLEPTITNFEYKIAFTTALDWEGGGASNIAATRSSMDGLPATQFTFKTGGKKNEEVEAWIIHTVKEEKQNGNNLRIPTFKDKTKKVELVVRNDGGQNISFYYYAESYGDKGGVTVTLAPNEKKTFSFTVNPGDSIGCNYALKLLSDVTTETNVTMYGYFDCTDELTSISLLKEASKKSFRVGETFSTEGIIVKANGDKYDDVVIANYESSINNGYEFTSDDVGTKTVTIRFGKYITTYDIEVTE